MSTVAPQPPPLGSPPQPAPFTMVPTCPELDLSLPLFPASPLPTSCKALPPSCQAPPPTSLVRGAACQQKIHCKREQCGEIPLNQCVTPAQPGANEKARCEERGVVLPEGVELNSTLALRAEIQDLAGAHFNSQKAVQQQLKSARTRDGISSRATEAVNVPPSQQLYRALVSINVEEELLISKALHDRLQLVTPTPVICCKKEAGPELGVFVRASQRREVPFLSGLDQAMPHPQPTTCPTHSIFDLYHKHGCWGDSL